MNELGPPQTIRLSRIPDFSIKDIRKIMPKALFVRSYLKSFYWLFHDIALVITMVYFAETFLNDQYVPFAPLRVGLWIIWWYVQGAFMTGLWVIAHECGHHAFSPNQSLNNFVGFIVHTMLLVPYFSWQQTHAQHHAATNNLEHDSLAQSPRMRFVKTPQFVIC